MSGFIGDGAPVFEIRDTAGPNNDMLVRSPELGQALAKSLGGRNIVLMRGHGSTVVGFESASGGLSRGLCRTECAPAVRKPCGSARRLISRKARRWSRPRQMMGNRIVPGICGTRHRSRAFKKDVIPGEPCVSHGEGRGSITSRIIAFVWDWVPFPSQPLAARPGMTILFLYQRDCLVRRKVQRNRIALCSIAE